MRRRDTFAPLPLGGFGGLHDEQSDARAIMASVGNFWRLLVHAS